MKKFTQILLASFALTSLVFAGCNAQTADDETVTTDTDGTVQVEATATPTTTTTTTTAQ